MTFADFITKSKNRFEKDGASALPHIATDFIISATAKAPLIPQFGRKVFEHDWDVLLVIDACRWDMYETQVGSGERVWSSGSSSPEWMEHNFTEEYCEPLSETVYVTANPWSEKKVDGSLVQLDEVWRYAWDNDLGTVHPTAVTDRVMNAYYQREGRVIGHYMQPHYPFIASGEAYQETKMDLGGFGRGGGRDLALWDQFMYGERDDIEAVMDEYMRNLAFVMGYVETVIENVKGTVVVTADHGNACGELGAWGHKPGFIHPKMRWVPWDVRDGGGKHEYEPEIEGTQSDGNVEERLQELGYV